MLAPDYIDPIIGIPVSLVLFAYWGVLEMRARRETRR